MPSETRTSLISLSGSIVVHSFPTLPRPILSAPPSPAPGALALIHSLIYRRADFQNSPNECERTTLRASRNDLIRSLDLHKTQRHAQRTIISKIEYSAAPHDPRAPRERHPDAGVKTAQSSQSVSYFTVPPRAHPSTAHRLAVRLRHSRSNTSTEYSLPGATQLSQVRSISPSGQGVPCGAVFGFALNAA